MLNEVDVAQPELQVEVKRHKSALVKETGPHWLCLLELKVDVVLPCMLLVGQAEVGRVNLLDLILEWQTLVDLSLGLAQNLLLSHLGQLISVRCWGVQHRFYKRKKMG